MRKLKTFVIAPQLNTLIIALIWIFNGCAPSKTILLDSATPIRIGGQTSSTISVANITSSIPPDQKIGQDHTGLLKIPGEAIYASAIINGISACRIAAEEELVEAGYRVVVVHQSVFGQTQDEVEASDFLIGGTVIDCKYNTYRAMGSVSDKAEVTVEWQLLDKRSDQVVFKSESSGLAKGPGKTLGAFVFAVRGSLRNMLADEDFVQAIKIKTTLNKE